MASCAWVEAATASPPESCGKVLRAGSIGYCPKHRRMFRELEARTPRCVRCGAELCDCGEPRVRFR